MGWTEHEGQVRDQQGANGTAPTTALPAMSSFPSLVSIACTFLSPDPSLDQTTPPHNGLGGPRRGITKGSKAGPLGFKAA
jgi:hypothetical protein